MSVKDEAQFFITFFMTCHKHKRCKVVGHPSKADVMARSASVSMTYDKQTRTHTPRTEHRHTCTSE